MSHFHFLNKVQPPQVTSLNLPPNTACVLLKKQTISVEATPLPILQPDGVLVKVITTGICGSDLHNYLAGGVGGRPVTEPIVMGHESSGEVIAVGDLVTSHKIGDRVASELSWRLLSRLELILSRAGTAVPTLRKLQERTIQHLHRCVPKGYPLGFCADSLICDIAVRLDLSARCPSTTPCRRIWRPISRTASRRMNPGRSSPSRSGCKSASGSTYGLTKR
jgi:hypothetical protein